MSAWYTPGDLTALSLSFKLAAATSAILLVVATPIALWLSVSRSRFAPWVESLVTLPVVLPPTVLGFYLLCVLGPDGFIGQAMAALGLSPWAFRFEGILLASVVYSLPFVVQPLQNAFRAVGSGLLEAASTLRASPVDTFFSVVAPLSARAFLSGAVLAFAHTLGEFGVILLVGGNIPGRTQTASLAIFSHVEAMDYAAAHRLSATLVFCCFTLLAGVYLINRRVPTAEVVP